MEITPRELRDIEIRPEMRGYNRDDVNELLERAAAAIEAANDRVTQLSDRLNSVQSEAGRTRETEDILHRTLLLAQRAADEAVAEATAKSRQMLDDAEIQSRRLV
ncbi:MAG TPA: DivIVA domain-containing protein, partial [Acidimicrobiia bacterium]|nr:DivIVA domain-containing protein [Acidimicrobiia bacterium]